MDGQQNQSKETPLFKEAGYLSHFADETLSLEVSVVMPCLNEADTLELA